MSVFDFFKKKELALIERLKQELNDLDRKFQEKIELNGTLERRVKILSKFEQIVDAEQEASRLIAEATKQADGIIKKAKDESDELLAKANTIVENAIKRECEAREYYAAKQKQAEANAAEVLDLALDDAKQMKQKATLILDNATQQVATILKNAENKAIEIAGDAYKVKEESQDLTKTITALKNTINGYGDEYLIPTYSLLDQLSADFGFTEAGEELKKARERTRLMVKNGMAAQCDYVEDYRRITAINFTMDAFNGKVDTILSNVKQDNFGTLKQKIVDAYQLVNNLGKAFRNAVITPTYLDARLDELKWAVVVTELRNQEREEQRRIKEQIREEEKAKREYEKALKDAEKEEQTIKKALEKVQAELNIASEAQKSQYEQKLAELSEKLKIAEERGQRALSMAQQTKSGHVYVISNIGSFGENVYKIGMTRRLEPEERVKELGDASVPFSFDVHAMIYSEDAPSLETDLHKYFVNQQMNKVNSRKEFFKVGVSEIRKRVEELNLSTKWTMTALATEYKETIAIENEINNSVDKKTDWERSQLGKINQEVEEDEIESVN